MKNLHPAESMFGERVADRVAEFGGSWTFIPVLLGFMLVWIVIKVVQLFSEAFDPYPFSLLNLILSCLAALQAPVIMCQNRQESKDRKRAKQDYQINQEAEIRTLHKYSTCFPSKTKNLVRYFNMWWVMKTNRDR